MKPLSRLAMLIGLAGITACGGTTAMPKPPPAARLDSSGVTPRDQTVESGALLQFENDDVRPHEIYSHDCPELATGPLAPGEAVMTYLELGPKLCHFQDLLAPTASEFWGTVRVSEPPPPPPLTSDGG
jgi:hypothetical protein